MEHDPEEIWESVVSTLKEVFNKCSLTPSDIAAVGITNQRETTLVWDKHSGKPVYNAIVWQDRRTAQYCRDFSKDEAFVSYITEATGLLLDPYFSATKIAWILDNVEGAREKAENGDLLFGTVDSYLIWRLTGGESHKTGATNASRTMLFDIHNQCWDEKLLSKFNIPASMLPEVMDCAADFGVIKEEIIGRSSPSKALQATSKPHW